MRQYHAPRSCSVHTQVFCLKTPLRSLNPSALARSLPHTEGCFTCSFPSFISGHFLLGNIQFIARQEIISRCHPNRLQMNMCITSINILPKSATKPLSCRLLSTLKRKLWESNQDQRKSLNQQGNLTDVNGTIKKRLKTPLPSNHTSIPKESNEHKLQNYHN